MPKLRLTDIAVRSLKPAAQQVTYWDEQLANFGCRVGQNGTKTFVVMLGERRQRRKIGRYGELSLQDARAEARRMLVGDTELKQQRPVSPSFADALDLFLKVHCAQKNKPSTAKETERVLRRAFQPAFGKKRLAEITTDNVARIIDKLMAKKSAANHAFVAIRTFLRWCVRRRYIEHSPCEGLQLPSRPRQKDRVLNDHELAAVWHGAVATGYPFGDIVRLLILTGQRRGEIAALHGAMIDAKAQAITLPAALTKNGRTHSFPYGAMSVDILDRLPARDGLLFAARGNAARPTSGWSKYKATFDKRCGVADWTLHDLRRTFATNLAALAVSPHVIERMLNHASGTISGVAAVYNRFQYADEMRAALSAWEGRLDALTGKNTAPSSPHGDK